MGLRLLAPIVSPKGGRRFEPTPQEIVEYACLLEKVGVRREALRKIAVIDAAIVPEVLYCRAATLVGQWEYADALPLFLQYAAVAPTPYLRLVAHVNAAASLVALDRRDEAVDFIGAVQADARALGANRLLANTYELRSQLWIRARQLKEANADLDSAAQILRETASLDSLFVKKWRSIVDALAKRELEPLLAFRADAERMRDWESVRDADFYANVIQFDKRRHEKLFFGTPFLVFRDRIRAEIGEPITDGFILLGPPTAPCLDLELGHLVGADGSTAGGRNSHALLIALFRDFYRPCGIGNLFEEVFPDEHFDMDSSPDRMRQAIARARSWLRENDIALSIEENRRQYRASRSEGLSIRVPCELKVPDPTAERIARLQEKIGTMPFAYRQVRDIVDLPATSFHRFIAEALERGLVQKSGRGRATCYKISA
jgi:tetratricopeptide (TPR) repeat protein